MKLRNTTYLSDDFLKNVMRWCCAELGMPFEAILAANFEMHNRRDRWSGRANYKNMSIYIRLMWCGIYPTQSHWNGKSKRAEPFFFEDDMEVLVNIVAHEIAHLMWHHDGRKWDGTEGAIDGMGNWIVRVFRPRREELLATWGMPPSELRSAATS